MNTRIFARCLCAVAAVVMGNTAFGQAPTQQFTVVVDSVLTLTAPADLSITHDTTDANQTFGLANWGVLSNHGTGATVDFTTTQVFQNGTFERDLEMTVSVVTTDNDISSNPVWSVNPTLTTYASDYNANNRTGHVQATSSSPGNATLGLQMVFVDNDYSLLPSGNYTVTVTGTISGNP
ncbi:MAG: hypothetical protein R3C49_08000 [Planctomycetaceae bacterium]